MATASPQLDDLPAVGTTLAGKYEVVRLLGRGGMGAVLEARHLKLGENVALKILLPQLRSQEDVNRRFEREARAAAKLKGVHVARVLDVDSLDDGAPFMVMELLRGRDLERELDLRGTLPVAEAVQYVVEACAAMAEAHRAGIVHRDLKPSNLFLAEQEGGRVVKVLDFGISKVSGDVNAHMTTTASAFGTPLYMSPEQVRSVKDVDHRTDIWSLGVILYEALAGKAPFDHESPTAILAAVVADKPARIETLRPDVPRLLADAIMKTLSKQPSERFADVRAFADAIAPFAAHVPSMSLRIPPTIADPTSAPHSFVVGERVDDAASLATTAISDLSSRDAAAAARRRSTTILAVSALATIVVGASIALAVASRTNSEAGPEASAVAPPETPPSAPAQATQPPAVASPAIAVAPERPPEVTPTASASAARRRPAGPPARTAATPGQPPAPTPPAPKPAPAVTTDPKYL